MPVTKSETKQKPSIDVSVAARAAMNYAGRLFPNAGEFTLEEVELSEDGKFWMITLGYARKMMLPDPLKPVVPAWVLEPPRQVYDVAYKVFTVNAKTGEVVAMKMRPLE
jgi:hypothetical protein